MAGPPINGFTDLIRVIEDLQKRVRVLENARERSITLGADYRIEVQGGGLASSLHAIRTSDGNDKTLAP